MEQTKPYSTLVPPKFIAVVLKLHEKFENKNIWWALGGDLGEALKSVRVDPDCVEIVTSRFSAGQIHDSVEEFNPGQIEYGVQLLLRNAVVAQIKYPVYIRSYHFEFSINQIKIKVFGDLQFKVNDWEWGDKLEFEPSTVRVVNRVTNLVPLYIKYELYQALGWTDRMEKIGRVVLDRVRVDSKLK